MVEIFESLLIYKQGDLSLQAYFAWLQALLQEVLSHPLQTQWRWRAITRSFILACTWVGLVPPSHTRFKALLSLVIIYLASLLISLSLFASRLVCLPPLSLLLQVIRFLLKLRLSRLFGLAMMVSLPTLMGSPFSWVWPQLFSAMSLLWQERLSWKLMLEPIWQASYCPNSYDSFNYPFSNFAQYCYSTLSCDLDVSWVWHASPL